MDEIEFSSEREAMRYEQLRDQQKYNQISELVLWPILSADINGKHCFRLKVSCMYVRNNKQVVEYSREKVSPGWTIKWKVLQALYYRQYVFKVWPLDYDKKLAKELAQKEYERRIRTRLFNTRPPAEGFDRALSREHVHYTSQTKIVEPSTTEPSTGAQNGGGAVDRGDLVRASDESPDHDGSGKVG